MPKSRQCRSQRRARQPFNHRRQLERESLEQFRARYAPIGLGLQEKQRRDRHESESGHKDDGNILDQLIAADEENHRRADRRQSRPDLYVIGRAKSLDLRGKRLHGGGQFLDFLFHRGGVGFVFVPRL